MTPSLALADEVTDTLNNALAAYEDGDIQYALKELEFAKRRMNAGRPTHLLAGPAKSAPK